MQQRFYTVQAWYAVAKTLSPTQCRILSRHKTLQAADTRRRREISRLRYRESFLILLVPPDVKTGHLTDMALYKQY